MPAPAGEPSITINGVLLAVNEPVPRNLIDALLMSPASPELFNTCRPATLPCKASATLAVGLFSTFSPPTFFTEPTTVPTF